MQVSNIFQAVNEYGDVVEVQPPQRESLETLCGRIAKHYGTKDSVVTDCIQFYINELMWNEWYQYKLDMADYIREKSIVDEHNLLAVDNDEMEMLPPPVEPVWSDDNVAVYTVDYVNSLTKVAEAKKIAVKNKGVDIGGILASLTKSDQNGLGDLGVVVLFKELVDNGVLTADADVQAMLDVLPEQMDFHFQNGVVAPLDLNMNGFCRFTLPFLNHRQTVL